MRKKVNRVEQTASARVRRFALVAIGALSLLASPVARLTAGQRGAPDETTRALDGAIDIHVHSYPDNAPRSIDGLEVSILSRARGMRGLVLKNHYEPTAGLAYMVRKQVAGLDVFGGIDLNLTVGGMNPAAVEHMTAVSGGWGRLVWMSTFDAENQVRVSKTNLPFVRVSKDGQLLPETKAVIAVIAKHKELVLATGHVSPEEGLMILAEGKRQGVQHMVVTHAINTPVLMSVPQMQAAAKLGAFIEFAGGSIAGANGATKMDTFADAIKKVGPEFCIVSTDLGQKGAALPPDGFAAIVLALRARGLSEQDTDRMTKQNPARLLGLP